MLTGGGKIVFAHVEEVIDFSTIEDLQRYVDAHESKTIYYLSYPDKETNRYELSSSFCAEKHIFSTGLEDRPYSITVWIPYNGHNMGC